MRKKPMTSARAVSTHDLPDLEESEPVYENAATAMPMSALWRIPLTVIIILAFIVLAGVVNFTLFEGLPHFIRELVYEVSLFAAAIGGFYVAHRLYGRVRVQ